MSARPHDPFRSEPFEGFGLPPERGAGARGGREARGGRRDRGAEPEREAPGTRAAPGAGRTFGPPSAAPGAGPWSAATWRGRWEGLARAQELEPDAPLLVALSGGADSVLLLHLVARARPRPRLRAAHVDHGLRGAESDADAAFSAALCERLEVPFTRLSVELDPAAPSLEARARGARYRALLEEARRTGHTTLLTGHHADDALETLLMRWVRGTSLHGLAGLRRKFVVTGRELAGTPDPAGSGSRDDAERATIPEEHDGLDDVALDPVTVCRPLVGMRREEVRRILRDHGLAWREDATNADPAFTRNRVRHGLLPLIERCCGEEGVERLRDFGRAVEGFEEHLAGATAHIAWAPPRHAVASRGPGRLRLGGTLPRSALTRLPRTLRRRVLWRLVAEGTGHPPGRALLRRLEGVLARGRCGRHTLPGAWTLILRAAELQLVPPRRSAAHASGLPASARAGPPRPPRAHQLALPFPASPRLGRIEPEEPAYSLSVPGVVRLPDGRCIAADRRPLSPSQDVPRGRVEVELDAEDLPERLTVRWPRRGDRFHPLGAPGSKPLRRFLADAGIPREERESVPLVCADGELLWVVGVRPSERRRVGPRTRVRLALSVHGVGEPA